MSKDKYVVICDEPIYGKTYTYTATTFKNALNKAKDWNQFYRINCCRIAKVVVDYGEEIL